MSINRVVISGNLTRDPELRTLESGLQILDFRIGFNNRKKNRQTGEWENKPNFIDCKLFGNAESKRVEKLSHILCKGFKVALDGHLDLDEWEKDGQKRSKLVLIVDDMELMTRREDGGIPEPSEVPGSTPALATEDIPF